MKPMGAVAEEVEALTASGAVSHENNTNLSPCGFLNEGNLGHALTGSGEEVNTLLFRLTSKNMQT